METTIEGHSEEHPADFRDNSSKWDTVHVSGASHYYSMIKKRKWIQASAEATARICKKLKISDRDICEGLTVPEFWEKLKQHYKESDEIVAQKFLTKINNFSMLHKNAD
ncbi:hypothetical protein BJ878DRAFT_545603 [Calycina marina]|uniref:Uncharacterized protein n=1 Tax=Calycina marina TaxID=1763456 RepID=A0A9P8CBL2_9HELO|nr:hypothetical protein BJ878DRAFT_545603 [Calycina marina]